MRNLYLILSILACAWICWRLVRYQLYCWYGLGDNRQDEPVYRSRVVYPKPEQEPDGDRSPEIVANMPDRRV